MEIYKKLFAYVPDKKYLAILTIIISSLSAFFNILGYFFIYKFIKTILFFNNIVHAKNYALLIAFSCTISSLLYFGAGYISHKLGFRLETNLRKKGIEGLTNANFRFFDLYPSGLVRKIIDDNASQTHTIIAHFIPDSSIAILAPILSIILAFIIDIKIGLILLLITFLEFLLLFAMMGDKKFMKIYQEALEKMSAEMVEYIRGIQVIKIFKINVISFKMLNKAIDDYGKYAYDYTQSCKKPYVLFQLIFLGSIAFILPAILFFTNYHSNPKELALNLIMLIFFLSLMFVAFIKIMYVSMYSFQAKNALDKLEDLYINMQKDSLKFGTLNEFKNFDIEFDNVSFAYKEKKVIENLSFKLDTGKTYALVGSSGSGKSTIAKLISGFYKIDSGQIKIAGLPIENYSKEALISNICFVFQDAKLFKTSIYENVKIANPNASSEEVLNALKLASCNSILDKLKDREHTIIGSKGVFLSGGEKQRIVIARAILKKANIIIMDEASAAIDPDNEYELQLAFSNLIKDKTVVMIAHRLSSIKNVDEILVLKDGKIIERGSHEKLMTNNTKYKEFQELYSSANEWRFENEKIFN